MHLVLTFDINPLITHINFSCRRSHLRRPRRTLKFKPAVQLVHDLHCILAILICDEGAAPVVPRTAIANHGKVEDAPVRLKDKGEVVFDNILGYLADEEFERLVKPSLLINEFISLVVLALRGLILFLGIVALASVVIVNLGGLGAVGRVARVGRPPSIMISIWSKVAVRRMADLLRRGGIARRGGQLPLIGILSVNVVIDISRFNHGREIAAINHGEHLRHGRLEEFSADYPFCLVKRQGGPKTMCAKDQADCYSNQTTRTENVNNENQCQLSHTQILLSFLFPIMSSFKHNYFCSYHQRRNKLLQLAHAMMVQAEGAACQTNMNRIQRRERN